MSLIPLTFLITGAARGIGRGLTRILLTNGHRVFLLDSNSHELHSTLAAASAWTSSPETKTAAVPSFQGKVVDLKDRMEVKEAMKEVKEFCAGKLDCLVNNAMATPHVWGEGRRMEDEDAEEAIMREWDEKVEVGLTAPFLLSRLCVPLLKSRASDESMKRATGSIVNVSSTRAMQAEVNHEAYSAVKAGILGLTQSMALSLGHAYGIRVNAVVPGWIHVENENEQAHGEGRKWEEGLNKEDHEWHPAGRVGKVEDIARAVMYLVESEFVTGEEVRVDGGVGRKMVYPE